MDPGRISHRRGSGPVPLSRRLERPVLKLAADSVPVDSTSHALFRHDPHLSAARPILSGNRWDRDSAGDCFSENRGRAGPRSCSFLAHSGRQGTAARHRPVCRHDHWSGRPVGPRRGVLHVSLEPLGKVPDLADPAWTHSGRRCCGDRRRLQYTNRGCRVRVRGNRAVVRQGKRQHNRAHGSGRLHRLHGAVRRLPILRRDRHTPESAD